MRITLVTDAWYPQTNGVVRTLSTVAAELGRLGHVVTVIAPDAYRSVPCPTYSEIRLVVATWSRIWGDIEASNPQAVHIATEGPLGLAARSLCLHNGWPFTTSFHTKFPEYVAARFGVPVRWSYRALRWFHKPAKRVMVATPSVRSELAAWGFNDLVPWTRGVDLALFRPRPKDAGGRARPVFLYVGRVAIEKNIEAFLALDLPGSKVVVGDGPRLGHLKRAYPDAVFLGAKYGEELAAVYSGADAFVFPSRTDTFGLVLLEALASGLPVAAFPVPGPLDVIGGTDAGVLSNDLRDAALRALAIPPERARALAERFAWSTCALQFLGNLAPIAQARPMRSPYGGRLPVVKEP